MRENHADVPTIKTRQQGTQRLFPQPKSLIDNIHSTCVRTPGPLDAFAVFHRTLSGFTRLVDDARVRIIIRPRKASIG